MNLRDQSASSQILFVVTIYREGRTTYITRTIKSEIQAAIRDLDKIILDLRAFRQLGGVDEVGCAEFLCPGFFVWVGVYCDNARGSNEG